MKTKTLVGWFAVGQRSGASSRLYAAVVGCLLGLRIGLMLDMKAASSVIANNPPARR